MQIITHTCESCGAALTVDSSKRNLVCEYCGNPFSIIHTKNSGKDPGRFCKFCKYCGCSINELAIICPECGRQVENTQVLPNRSEVSPPHLQPQIVNNYINNTYDYRTTNNTLPSINRRSKSKMTALVLCLFLGFFGAHKFYEGKTGLGILYIFTFGLFGVGWLVDFIVLLFKPSPYFI